MTDTTDDLERERKILRLLDEALTKPPETRADFLRNHPELDTDMLLELEAMVSETAIGLPERALAQAENQLLRELRLERGQELGPYRIMREIGQGGMGTVYLAQQVEPIQRLVALKVLHSTPGKVDFEQRFLSERQILAGMNHPHIAQILEGGNTPDGRPFFAMEYVKGLPLDQFCDEEQSSVYMRLMLFLKICDAIGFAHRRLIVHRDLKPGNILVTPAGEPKLLDFGIAKVLDPEFPVALAETQTDLRLMTPRYASPEQIRGLPITVASDIYSLGVILYELLCGHSPYRFTTNARHDLERAVLDQDPRRPSTLLQRRKSGQEANTGFTLEEICRNRDIAPKRLQRVLSGDLDAIVMKALRKEPEQRYADVDALAEDIRAFLNGFPIAARKGARFYAFGKFIGRHKWLATGAIVALLSFGTATWLEGLNTRRERLRAESEEATAERTVSFLVDMFAIADPAQALGETITAKEILDRGANQIEADPRLEAPVKARLMHTIGKVYLNLGLSEQAAPALNRAAALAPPDAELLRLDIEASLVHLAILRSEYDKAVERVQRVLTRSEALAVDHPDRRAEVLLTAGSAFFKRGDWDLAKPLLEQARTQFAELYGQNHPKIAASLEKLGQLAANQGDLDQAGPHYRRALEIREQVLGPRHPDTLTSLNDLGQYLQTISEFDEACHLFEKSLTLSIETLGDGHPSTAERHNDLAVLLQNMGEMEPAYEHLMKALHIYETVFGESHLDTALCSSNVGVFLQERGELGQARYHYLRALAIQRNILQPDHPDIALTLNNLGALYQDMGDLASAYDYYDQSLALRLRGLGEKHFDTAISRNNLATLLLNVGDLEGAHQHYLRAYDSFRNIFGPEHINTAVLHNNLAAVEHHRGNYANAESMFREVLKRYLKHFPDDHFRISVTRGSLGHTLSFLGEDEEALELLELSYERLWNQMGPDHRYSRDALRRLLHFHEEHGNEERAAELRAQRDALN
ncbi:Non-specific serine/threonine protein kinase [Sulfidibacter corallicola]|uniref:Serine/threonine protein kinase n=1 Tax=Sulfidibacter corallicola TaxID=2818388 RepID=A0A8A4TRG9_SULCO|nr:serine/threonine-protein kinase [Sulfidibacter corallicola]QTD51682.1 serine/threonine protein kinase [Sulfidibacter corallicola]